MTKHAAKTNEKRVLVSTKYKSNDLYPKVLNKETWSELTNGMEKIGKEKNVAVIYVDTT